MKDHKTKNNELYGAEKETLLDSIQLIIFKIIVVFDMKNCN